jgi:hypothetical protein
MTREGYAFESVDRATATFSVNQCTHQNGVYHTCKFKFLLFTWRKRYLICTDCGKSIIQERKNEK